jgi:hypothetical protein
VIVGPLQRSYKGNIYIIVATDYLTRWTESKAIKHKTADAIAKFIMSIMCVHGPPEEILSDRGREFLNTRFTDFFYIPTYTKVGQNDLF